MKKTILLLAIIAIVALFLRFYRLGDVPVGLHRDEAFLGYNAYSILKTGRDMSGNFLPLHLQSFLYSPAGYSYFSIPFIKFFDLSAFSVRFASALFGSLTVLLTYFLSKRIFSSWHSFPRSSYGHLGGVAKRHPRGETIALCSAFLLAISPWHINLSRTATENTLVVFFISLGVLFYLHWFKRSMGLLLLFSFISFGLTFLLYQAPRAFLPFFIPLLFILFRKPNIDRRQLMFAVGLFFVFILTPLISVLSSSELSLRIRTVSVFATSESQLYIDEMIREDGVSGIQGFITRALHNKPMNYSLQVVENYFKHFSYDFLFTDQGFPGRYRIPHSGIIYLFELPFLMLGMWGLLRINRKIGLFLGGWVALGPLGSAFAFDDVPNLQRVLLVFPTFSIISAFGLLYFVMLLRVRKIVFVSGACILTIVAAYSIVFYLHQYYVHAPRYMPWYRNDGYKLLVEKVNTLLPFYTKAVITDREAAPTIFFLLYNKYDPLLFQQETKGLTMKGFDRIGFDKYEFSQEECPLKIMKKDGIDILTGENDILYVDSGLCKVPPGTRELAEVRRKDNSLVFRILVIE